MLLIYFIFFLLSGLVKLWSALTLLGFYQNRRCAFRVLQVKPCGAGWLPPNVSSRSKVVWLAEHTASSLKDGLDAKTS